jgi:hypothetical protein
MLDPIIKEPKKRNKRKNKKDKIKRWSIVFVEDSDNEREEVKLICNNPVEKSKDQMYND